MARTTIDFGIDLGTTNSTAAVIDGIDAKVIPNGVGAGITPSAVWIDKRGTLRVGQESKLRALIDDPDNADVEFKLRMGSGADGSKRFARSGRELRPEELSAEVLKSLRRDVQSSMGEDVTAAVVTVPAAFENSQTNATMKAAALAGLTLSPLLLEPVAASLAYGFQSESENVYWFVYDFGGGTFDAAVMRIRDGLIQVVNHDGDNFLGGKLIDWDIVTRKLMPAIAAQFGLPDFRRGNPRWRNAIGTLKYHAEQAKIEVCRTKAPAEVWIEGLCQDGAGREIDVAYTLTPADVEEVSRPYIAQSLDLCRATLRRAGLTGQDMHRVLMVGGTTLNPWVRDAVQAELGSRLEFGIDPVTVVARGAAIFASTQPLPHARTQVAPGTWRVDVEHRPVGNVADPDIGGRVVPPDGLVVQGCTIEFVDNTTGWRSGLLTLGPGGVFLTQLYAERQRRHEYTIELRDATGSRLTTSPDRVAYTIGVLPEEHPPAAMTIGIGLANGAMKTYVAKGARLPVRRTIDHYTTVALRAGHAEDELHIPLLEGEHPRADRNHGVGRMTITGAQIRRDLPVGSAIEITLLMDTSQQVRLQAFVNALDEDFEEIAFDPEMTHSSPEALHDETGKQRRRLQDARSKVGRMVSPRAEAALAAIDDQRLPQQVDSLLEAARDDRDAVTELDRRLRALAAAIDQVEDAVEWPELLDQAEASRRDAAQVVDAGGEARDRSALRALEAELQRTIDVKDVELLRKHIEDLDALYFTVVSRRQEFHIARFNWLATQQGVMRDQRQAAELVAQGRRHIEHNNPEGLKAANRQLLSLLPREVQAAEKHANVGDTLARE